MAETAAPSIVEVHVAGPVEPEPTNDYPSGVRLVQRCLRCDDLLLERDSADFAAARRRPLYAVGSRVGLAFENGKQRAYVLEGRGYGRGEGPCSYYERGL